MAMEYTMRELLARRDCVLAPEIYDCLSAQSVEESGFEATVLSGCELAWSMLGVPDLGLMGFEELLWATTRIASYSRLPMIVDCENGYGPVLNTYRNCRRMAQAGAAGVILVDGPETRVGGCLPVEQAVEKYEAAHEALKDTDCILVARTDAEDLSEAMERCNRYREAGADMTLVFTINNIRPSDRYDACKTIARNVDGWKWYPDLGAHDGKTDVTLEQVAELGFNFVGVHYLMSAALWAMKDAGVHNFANRNSVYSTEKYPISGLGTNEQLREWLHFEQQFVKDPALEDRWPYSVIKRGH